MSTTVISSNIGVVATGTPPSNWKDTSNLVGTNNQSDNLYAYYEFDGTPDAGQEYDEALYLRAWGFNLPEFSVVEDIQVNIERKASGTGTVTDQDIRLYFPDGTGYDSTNLTINQASGSSWPSSDGVAIYSGTWNETWTDTEINNPLFGVFIRATESVTTNNTALIDFVQVQVTYYQDIQLEGSSGGSCGGSATVELADSIDGAGGVAVGGHAPFIYPNIDATGGLVAEGSATLAEEVSAAGGMVISGTAIISSEATGSGGATLGGSATIQFIDEVDGTGGIVLGGEAQVESGIFGIGGVVIGGEAIAVADTFNETAQGGMLCGGSAEIQYVSNIEPTEGVVINGASVNDFTYSITPDGGIVIGGVSIIAINVAVGGGIVIGGETSNQIDFAPVITGGLVAGGEHQQTFIDYYIAIGGVRVSGKGNGNKIKFFEKFRTGICQALESDNICKEDPYQQELLPPPGSEDVELDPNRFRIEYLPTWCDIEKELQPYEKVRQDCDAGVADIIKKRQKGIVPPKSGRAQIRDRGIATSDAL